MLRGMARNSTSSIAEKLTLAASEIIPVPNREPWNYGWCVEEYRHSERAALTSSKGPVTMNEQGISAYEDTLTELLKDGKVRDRWETEELWGVVALLVVRASEKAEERLAVVE